ncbi:MAG: hypothetical protein E7324_02045 [Clostridiales bacterium]|nr:hypothetical protein [Clostridiales bacterium]
MDYSAANQTLWSLMIELGVIAGAVLFCNVLRRKVALIRKSLIPLSVLAGFLLLFIKVTGIYKPNNELLEMLVFHCIALGFIAMSLRTRIKTRHQDENYTGFKSGALIVSTYLVQAIIGLGITLGLSYLLMPDLFQAAGLLLPMGFGQGPGQANNVGTTYETLGFSGGNSFGLAIAAAGYLCACTVGVFMLSRWSKKGLLRTGNREYDAEIQQDGYFQEKNEIPVSDSIDKLSVQICLVLLSYLITYLITWGITAALYALAPGLARMLNSLLWGFNFIIGSVVAMGVRVGLNKGQQIGLITRQYQNNYLLNRISGYCFDIMIVAGIASINPEDISGLWLPFVLMSLAGGIGTWLYLKVICKKLYPGYYREGLISMYGMLTGTIGSGILLLREIDPELSTPAANNLVIGSSYGIVLGAPLLVLISLAAESTAMCFLTLGLAALYLGLLLLAIYRIRKKPSSTS